MNSNIPSRRSEDSAAGLAALIRASQEARRLAERTNTPFFVWQDGKVVDLNADRPFAASPDSKIGD